MALKGAPVRRWQARQWHTAVNCGGSLTISLSAPQAHWALAMAKPDNAGAGSTDYMHLFGLVVLGYMWAKMAKTAEETLAAGETRRADYLKNKLITAKFFMTDDEFARIGVLVRFLPSFDGFDEDHLIHIGRDCAAQLAAPEGLDVALEMVREALPKRLYETAYALAVEIAAADQRIRDEEIRLLQLLRDRFGLDKLTCAAIERGAIARFRK